MEHNRRINMKQVTFSCDVLTNDGDVLTSQIQAPSIREVCDQLDAFYKGTAYPVRISMLQEVACLTVDGCGFKMKAKPPHAPSYVNDKRR